MALFFSHLQGNFYGSNFLTFAGGMAAVSLAMPTKLWDSAGRECGRTFLYLHFFFRMARGQAKNPNHNNFQFAALLSQSGIKFGHLRLSKLHLNLPQIFAETMSPTVF